MADPRARVHTRRQGRADPELLAQVTLQRLRRLPADAASDHDARQAEARGGRSCQRSLPGAGPVLRRQAVGGDGPGGRPDGGGMEILVVRGLARQLVCLPNRSPSGSCLWPQA